jgi:O-antigen/teichoic acid export membrane protein
MREGSPSLGRATVVSAFVDVALALAALLSTPVLVRCLGAERYGVIGLVTVLASQLATLQLGVGPALLRTLGEARGRGDAGSVRAALRAGALLALASAAAAFALAWWLAPRAWSDGFAASAGVREEALVAVPATAALLALQPILAVVFAALTGLERFSFLNGARLAHGLLRVALGVTVALRGGGLAGVLGAQAAADALVMVVALAASRRRAVAAPSPGPPVRRALADLLGLGVPLSLAGIVAGLLVDGDKLALGALRSVAEVAYYAIPAGVVARLSSFAGMASVFLVPRLAACAAAGNTVEAARLAARATRLALCVTAAAAGPLLALAPELLSLWLGPAFAEDSTLGARILLVGLLANVSVYGPHAAIRARAPALTLVALYALELPVFVLALWLLVRPWGVAGAAAAWTLRVALDAAAQHVLARRTLGQPIVPLALPALATLALGALAFACHLAGPSALALRAAGGLLPAVAALLLLPAEDRDSLRRALWLPATRGAA